MATTTEILVSFLDETTGIVIKTFAAILGGILVSGARKIINAIHLEKSLSISQAQEEALASAIEKGIYSVMEEERKAKKAGIKISGDEKAEGVYNYVNNLNLFDLDSLEEKGRNIKADINAALNKIRKDVTVGNVSDLRDPLEKI